MATKTDIKRLLKKGLTGWEAGLLVFEDSWLTDRNREGFLSESDLRGIKNGLRTQQDIAEYNNVIYLYRTVDHISRQAITNIMAAGWQVERAIGLAELAAVSYVARMNLSFMPLLVTEKQLQDLKAEQREKLKKRYYCLDEVISKRAYHEAGEEVRRKLELDPESIEAEAPELWQQAEQQIAGMIQAGELPEPTKLDIRASDDTILQEGGPNISFWEDFRAWTEEQAQKYLQDLSHWQNIRHRTEEQTVHYRQYYFSGEQLYQAGLPEWVEDIDTFRLWEIDESLWLSEDPPDEIAIVQDTWRVDERGHYKSHFLSHSSALLTAKENYAAIQTLCDTAITESEAALKDVLAKRQVLVEVGQIVGLQLQEDINTMLDLFKRDALERYNIYARDISPELERLKANQASLSREELYQLIELQRREQQKSIGNIIPPELIHIPPLKLEKIRPSAKKVNQVRSWISDILGENWWKQAGRGQEAPDVEG